MPEKPYKKLAQRSKIQRIAVAEPPVSSAFRVYGFAFLAAIFLAFELYSPALHGQFVFDDLFLSYTDPHAASLALAQWCGLRPVLGLSFWANFQLAGLDTFLYHAINVLLHSLNAILLFFIVRKLLELAGTIGLQGQVLAGFSATLFLVHPIQTEAVAYIASRSENLSVLFIFAAFCVFLYRPSAEVGWRTSGWILCLFAGAMGTKEHAIALPAIFLLTDYFFNPGFSLSGIRANWRLYIPVAFVSLVAAVFIWSYVSRDPTIGFHLKGLTWYQYFFTECRAVFGYVWFFVFPVGLNVDHEFAESLTVFDHGAIVAMGALALLVAAAYLFRRSLPLACYGFLMFVILLAPTSSFIPIRDVFVERRLYLPFIGLLLVLLELLRRVHMPTKSLVLILVCLCLPPAYLTWRRAAVWTSSTRLWEDSVATAPAKSRPHVGLGNAYLHDNRCREAAREYAAAYQLSPPDFTLKYNLAAAFECMKQPARAIPLLREAIAEKPTAAPGYALLGMVLAETGDVKAGWEALARAELRDPRYALTFAYRGTILARMGRTEEAGKEFEKCLRLDPTNQIARRGWSALNPGAER
jgi:protein O-mannosyl-transferase